MNNRLTDNGHGLQSVSFVGAGRQLVRRLLAIGENRLELLVVEMQEESQRLILMLSLAALAAALGLLAAMGFSAAIVVAFWDHPAVALVILGSIYAVGALLIGLRLFFMVRNLDTLPQTLDQIKKDRACLEKGLS